MFASRMFKSALSAVLSSGGVTRAGAARLSGGAHTLRSPLPLLGALPRDSNQVAALAYSTDETHPLFSPTPEHAQLRNMVAEFSRERIEPQAAAHDLEGTLNRELIKEVGELGLLGITVPEEDGGAGMDATAAVIVHEEMSKYDPGFALAYLAHSMLFVNNFYQCSNAEQRDRYLGKVVSGEYLAGMGMTEPGAGTDVLGMSTNAVRRGDTYLLNGSKIYITNGPEGDCFQVYAKVEGKITAFVVDRSMSGFSTGNKIDKCGMRGSTMGELFFENCEVPAANMLGAEGSGVTHMMRNLELERVTLAAMSCGIAERCLEVMVDYAKQRKAFGKSIHQFGQVQKFIAEAYANTRAMKALTYDVARNINPNTRNRLGSDAAKLFAAPAATKIASDAIQVLGGMGYCKEAGIERLWRDAKLLEIGGGTTESHHTNITKDLTRGL